jgi:hypothetical protein
MNETYAHVPSKFYIEYLTLHGNSSLMRSKGSLM